MRHLSIIILILHLVILQSCKNIKGKGLFGRKARLEAAFQARAESMMFADSISKVQELLLATKNEKPDSALLGTKNEKPDSVRKPDEKPLIKETIRKFNIIVGSFIKPEYAKMLAEVYRNKGYEARVIKREGNTLVLVSAESHESYSNALARLKEFQNIIEPNAWIYQDQLVAVENKKPDPARKPDEKRLISENKYKFNIIVGSFITPEYAKDLAEVYRNKGYDTRIITRQEKMIDLVSAESHESYSDALARLKEFRDTGESNAWIYIKE